MLLILPRQTKIITIMNVFVVVALLALLILAFAYKNKVDKEEEKKKERRETIKRNMEKLDAYEKEQKKEEKTPVAEEVKEEKVSENAEVAEEKATEIEDTDSESSKYDGLSYEEKIKAIEKNCEKILFETISSLELRREEKVEIMTELLQTLDGNYNLDETKILKAVVRKLYKTLISKTPDLLKRLDYEERFEEEKEEMRSRDYVVIDMQWNQFLDDFDELKEDIDNLLKGKEPVKEEIEDDETQYRVLNFAVKGLFFRTKEDQDAACTLHVGDPLHMEPEEGNEKDPYAMKVTMMDGHHIGYVDAKYSNYVKSNLYRLVKFKVSKIDDEHEPPYIYANAYYEKE